MKYFHSEGGNNRPYFIYRFKVARCTTEMYEWCEAYPDNNKAFMRWHVGWSHVLQSNYDIVQMESRDAYLAFQVAFAGEILEDLTMKEYK